jgi:cystathionine beta-synthase
VNQYHSRDNVEAHYLSTGAEIWEQVEGRIDAFVAGIGTGGTMSGAGKYLKEKNPAIKNVGVDPVGSVYHSMFHTRKMSQPHVYKVEGIGEDMMCGAMDLGVMDDVRQVDDKSSFTMARRMAREEGIFAGGSSGGAVHVAVQVAREMGKGKVIVVPLPDSGRAYTSKFYSDEWMRDNGFIEPATIQGATVRDVLGDRRGRVVTAARQDPVGAVVRRMKENDISQVPVVDGEGNAVGMVHESDLLEFLIEGKHRMIEPVEAVMASLEGRVGLETPVAFVRSILERGEVAVVMEGERCVGIVSKIDVIDFLGRRLS